MNLLLFEQRELNGSRLTLAGGDRRSQHIRNILKLKTGDSVRVGMVNGSIGKGEVLRIEDDGVQIDVSLEEKPQTTQNLTLILALPRPIMLQRILKQATVLGVKTFHLIRSEKVQKSYFQSNILQEKNLREFLIQGLEQAVDTFLPEVFIHERFKPFVEDVVTEIKVDNYLLAHPDTEITLPDIYSKEGIGKDVVLAIGPEGGWNDFEVQMFLKQGFKCFSFGSRILHVDTAVLVLLSQTILLQDIGYEWLKKYSD